MLQMMITFKNTLTRILSSALQDVQGPPRQEEEADRAVQPLGASRLRDRVHFQAELHFPRSASAGSGACAGPFLPAYRQVYRAFPDTLRGSQRTLTLTDANPLHVADSMICGTTWAHLLFSS